MGENLALKPHPYKSVQNRWKSFLNSAFSQSFNSFRRQVYAFWDEKSWFFLGFLLHFILTGIFTFKLLISPITQSYDWQIGSIPLIHDFSDARNLETLFMLVVFGVLLWRLLFWFTQVGWLNLYSNKYISTSVIITDINVGAIKKVYLKN